jgi:hypothetical protein
MMATIRRIYWLYLLWAFGLYAFYNSTWGSERQNAATDLDLCVPCLLKLMLVGIVTQIPLLVRWKFEESILVVLLLMLRMLVSTYEPLSWVHTILGYSACAYVVYLGVTIEPAKLNPTKKKLFMGAS